MAKLSAKGRKELVRVSKQTEDPETEACFCTVTGPVLPSCIGCQGTGIKATLTSWHRRTYALMSDGTILVKSDVQFRSDPKPHSYGWKVKGKAKAGMTAEAFAEVYVKAGYARA